MTRLLTLLLFPARVVRAWFDPQGWHKWDYAGFRVYYQWTATEGKMSIWFMLRGYHWIVSAPPDHKLLTDGWAYTLHGARVAAERAAERLGK